MADVPKPNKFRCSQLSWAARGECIVNEETGERIIDAGLDIYDGNESVAGVEKFARWLVKAARWAKPRKTVKSGFTFIELLLSVAIFFFVVSIAVIAIRAQAGCLRTVEHGDHLFVMSSTFFSSTFFLHHPSCKCHSATEAGR